MMNEMKEETCTCPQCSFEGPQSEFKPKQYADESKPEKKRGLEIYVTSSKDNEEDEENG